LLQIKSPTFLKEIVRDDFFIYYTNVFMKNDTRKVLIAAPVHPVLTDGLNALGYSCVLHENISQEIAFRLINDCVGVITSTRLQLDKGLIDGAPQLKWIGRMGSGMEVIDLAYAAQKGIGCYSSPEGNCNAVGEHALGMLLGLMRRIPWSQAEMQAGKWLREENRGTELEGKTMAIIGVGHTGQAFAKKLQGFDMRIIAYDKYFPGAIPGHIVNCGSLSQVFEEADIVSFHVPLQADTVHYLDEAFIAQMRKPFIVINTSRGPVVDTVALKKGITTGKIIGACLDVFEQEPLTIMNEEMRELIDELMCLPMVIVTPHIAGYTFEAVYKMSKTLLDKLRNDDKIKSTI
jgi:D-3-phosphoglycerate dehydrogenase